MGLFDYIKRKISRTVDAFLFTIPDSLPVVALISERYIAKKALKKMVEFNSEKNTQ